MDEAERRIMLNDFADPEGENVMEFSIARPVNDGKSISEEALDKFRDTLFLFIGGRICAFQTKEEKPATKLKVKIEVTVEGPDIQGVSDGVDT